MATRFVKNIEATYQTPEQKINDVCSAKYQIEIFNAYSAALIIDFRHPCPKSNRKPRGDYKASNAHLRTDLPKNKPTVSFLKASTAYMALRLERS